MLTKFYVAIWRHKAAMNWCGIINLVKLWFKWRTSCCLTALSHYLNQYLLFFEIGPFVKREHSMKIKFMHSKIKCRLQNIWHDDVIKWKLFPRYWPFVRGKHRSPVNSQHKGQWRGALMFSLFCVWINGWVNNHEDGDLRRYRAHYDVTVMTFCSSPIDGWTNSRHFLAKF